MDNAKKDFASAQQPILLTTHDSAKGGVIMSDVAINKPDGTGLISAFNLNISKKEKLVITGRSGCGKSTILRVLAGIWPHGTGTVALPEKTKTLILGQKPYFPLTTLRGIVCYPEIPDSKDVLQTIRVYESLKAVEMGHLAKDMDDSSKDSTHWCKLSGGEQQKIILARAIYNNPDILALDEATSALDIPSQEDFYHQVMKNFADSIVISVSHRREVIPFHTSMVKIENGRLSKARIRKDTNPIIPSP